MLSGHILRICSNSFPCLIKPPVWSQNSANGSWALLKLNGSEGQAWGKVGTGRDETAANLSPDKLSGNLGVKHALDAS